MQALLKHSIQNYHPLPSDLRCGRSRARSQPSPYPHSIKTSFSSSLANDQVRAAIVHSIAAAANTSLVQLILDALQEVTCDPNMIASPQRCEKLGDEKPIIIPGDKLERVFGLPLCPHIASTARRATQRCKNVATMGNWRTAAH